MAKHTHAQIILGGGAEPKNPATGRKGYLGRYPGVVEEAWRTLEPNDENPDPRPLYVAGGLGGAAGMVAKILTSKKDPQRLREKAWKDEKWFKELTAGLDADPDTKRLGLPRTMAKLASAIRGLAAPLLVSDEAALAWNGLTLKENHDLFACRDPLKISYLVLKGLLEVAAARASDTLRVELVYGSLTEASGLDVIAIPAFSDLQLSGAGEALDRVTNGAATRAHRAGGGPIEVGSDDVDMDYVFIADLGRMNRALAHLPEHVARASESTADMARRHGFGALGLVTFGGNSAERLEDVVIPMLDGLRSAAGTTRIVWFERDWDRFETLRGILENEQKSERKITVSTLKITTTPEPSPPAAETILSLQSKGDRLDVGVLVPRGNGLAPRQEVDFGAELREKLAGKADDRAPAPEILADRGRKLSKVLLGEEGAGKILGAFKESSFVVVHDVESSGVPYEMLAAETESGETVEPAVAGGMVRRLQVRGVSAERGLPQAPRAGKLHLLLVVNPTGDLTGAEREARQVCAQLTDMPVKVTRLEGKEATVDAVAEALADETLDILHYCGHGFFRGSGRGESGLNCADGELTLKTLMKTKHVPRVAFVNACQIGRVRAAAAQTHDAQAFAEFFLRAGVDAYIGTFWRVTDNGAAAFASEVYKKLAAGKTLAKAVLEGRRKLAKVKNSDWANYLLYGDGRFRLVRSF